MLKLNPYMMVRRRIKPQRLPLPLYSHSDFARASRRNLATSARAMGEKEAPVISVQMSEKCVICVMMLCCDRTTSAHVAASFCIAAHRLG